MHARRTISVPATRARRRAISAAVALAAGLVGVPAASAVISVSRPGGVIAVANNNGTGLTVVGHGTQSIMAPGGRAVLLGTGAGSPPEQLVLLAGTKPARTFTLPCAGINGVFSPNGRQLLCAGFTPGAFTQVAHRIDVASGAELPLPANTTSSFCGWSADSTRLACVRVDDPLTGIATGVELISAVTGATRVFVPGGRFVSALAFSPDGRTLAYSADGRLNLITLASGAQRVIATGANDFRFSPNGSRLAYVTNRNARGAGTLTIATIATGAKRHLAGHRVESLVYGRGVIALSLRRFFPDSATLSNQVLNIAVVRENGTGFRLLTHVKRQRVPRIGLLPLFFSRDGRRLVALFGGDDLGEAYAVDVVHGGARRVAHGGLRPTMFSDDGRFIYGDTASHTGQLPIASRNNVIRVAWTKGARPHVLVRHAALPDFSFGNDAIRSLIARRAP